MSQENAIDFLDDAPYPQNDPLVFVNKKGEGFVNEQQWGNWLLALSNSVNAAPLRISNNINLSDQNATLPAADLAVAEIVSGVYRISYAMRCSLPGGVSSSGQLTFVWTERGVVQTYTGTNVNGNTTTSRASETFEIRPDAGTAVTYAFTYASNPAAAATFDFDIILERLQVTTGG